jgi:hypothetical protein
MKLGYQVLPEFVVVQHERDAQILHALKTYFKCGYVKGHRLDSSTGGVNNEDRLCFVVRDVTHLLTIILPFFEKHSLKTKKQTDFFKFRRIVRMMGEKEHLNEQGLNEIKNIIKDMRKYYIIDHKRTSSQITEMKDKVQLFGESTLAPVAQIER